MRDELLPYRERCAARRGELAAALEWIVAFAARTPDIARAVLAGMTVYARSA